MLFFIASSIKHLLYYKNLTYVDEMNIQCHLCTIQAVWKLCMNGLQRYSAYCVEAAEGCQIWNSSGNLRESMQRWASRLHLQISQGSPDGSITIVRKFGLFVLKHYLGNLLGKGARQANPGVGGCGMTCNATNSNPAYFGKKVVVMSSAPLISLILTQQPCSEHRWYCLSHV